MKYKYKMKRRGAGAVAAAAKRKYRAYKARRSMIPRGVRNDFLRTTRTFWVQNWTPGVAATNDFWRYFAVTLGDMPNFNDYANIYDSYKINRFTVTLRPRYDGFNGENTTDTTLPGVTNQGATRVHVVIDPKRRSNDGPTGAYTSATLNLFFERGKCKTYTGNKAIKVMCKYPCILDDMNGNANSKAIRAPWCQTNITNIAHQGIHVFLQDINLTGTFGQSFDVFYTFDISFKGQR